MVCPGCKKDNSEVVYKETENFKDWISEKPSYKITDTFRVHGAILRCLSCGLVFVPRDENLDMLLFNFYVSQKVDQVYLEEEYGRRKMASKALERLGLYGKVSNLIDVGTGPAFFVSEAVTKGWNAEGVESGKEWWDFAKEKLKLDSVVLGGLEVLEAKPDSSFGVITAWDFIEHILDPIGFINLAFSKIEPGGVLALSTPRFDSIASKIFKEKWHAIIPSHITYFTKSVLISYLEKAGFEVIGTMSYQRYFSIQYLLNRSFHKNSKSFLSDVVIPVNLFDEIEIYARKPFKN